MRTPFDRFAKDLFGVVLEPVCRVVPEREVSGDAQRIDLWCEPNPARLRELDRFTLIRRLVADGPCAFEFFHQAPALGDVLRSLHKVLTVRLATQDERTREAGLWIIAGGRPAQVLERLPSLRPDPTWSAGVYSADPGLGLHLIVTSELPATPHTLLLRLLSAGLTLKQALREVRQLPDTHPVRRLALPFVIKLHLEVRQSAPGQPELEEFVMETQSLYEMWQQKLLAEGEARGEARGEAKALLAVLAARGIAVVPEHVHRIDATRDLAQLDVWLARAATARTIEEVFG
jgi:hypothetical protein